MDRFADGAWTASLMEHRPPSADGTGPSSADGAWTASADRAWTAFADGAWTASLMDHGPLR